jgi:hypothetical protein
MAEDSKLCGALTAILIAHPDLVPASASAYTMLDLEPEISCVREVILRWDQKQDGTLADALKNAGISDEDISALSENMPKEVRECVLIGDGRSAAETIWWQLLSCIRADILATELIIADHDYRKDPSKANKKRFELLSAVMSYVVETAAQEAASASAAVGQSELGAGGKSSSEIREAIIRAIASVTGSETAYILADALGAAAAQVALVTSDPGWFVRQVHKSADWYVQKALLREKAAAGTVH